MMPRVLTAVAALNRGRVRPRNEDALILGDVVVAGQDRAAFVQMPQGRPVVLAVADGLGGHPCGDVASQRACRDLSRAPLPADAAGLITRLIDIDYALKDAATDDPACMGMGTTIAGVLLTDESVLVFNIGDSTVFRIEDGLLRRVSVSDALTDAQGRSGALLQCLGGRPQGLAPAPHVTALPPDADCPILICTDGLTNLLSIWDIEAILMGGGLDPVGSVNALVDAACAAGGHDNIAIILCQWLQPGALPDV